MALRLATRRLLGLAPHWAQPAFACGGILRAATTGAVEGAGSDTNFGLPIDTLIKADHNKVRHLFSEYEQTTEQEHKQLLAYAIIRELSMHSSKEEEVVYPVFGEKFGPEAQQHLCDEHYVLKLKLEKLSKLEIASNHMEFDQAVSSVKSEFLRHIKEEEEQEIPRLLKQPGVDSVQLGMKFEQAAAHAVTRPHPMAPDKPPFNLVTNRMTAPLDAMADQVRFKGNIPEVPTPPPQ